MPTKKLLKVMKEQVLDRHRSRKAIVEHLAAVADGAHSTALGTLHAIDRSIEGDLELIGVMERQLKAEENGY